MALTKTENLVGFNIEMKNGVLHKVFKKVSTVLKDGDVVLSTSVDNVPAARADLETILSSEAALTAESLVTVQAEKETAEAALAPVQAELDALKAVPDEEFPELSRPSFLFMAKKLGMTEETIEGLIALMPEGTQEEIDAKDIAELVFANQQTFERTNPLLNKLIDMSPLTHEMVDTAWGPAAALNW